MNLISVSILLASIVATDARITRQSAAAACLSFKVSLGVSDC
jgi:hypothetical protein